MEDVQIVTVPVTVYKNAGGFFPSGITKYISCENAKKSGEATFSLVRQKDSTNCTIYEQGQQVAEGFPDSIKTVKMSVKTPAGSEYVYISEDDYTSIFLVDCDPCCVP